MGKGKKFMGKKRKGNFKGKVKKHQKSHQDHEARNKKALFNRYKDKQKIEEVLLKKKQMEEKFLKQNVSYSESESEEDVYEQLVSCLKGAKYSNKVIESDDDEISSTDENTLHETGEQNMTQTKDGDDSEVDNAGYQDIMITNHEENENDIDTIDDPFTKHFEYELGDELLVSLSNNPPNVKETHESWPTLKKIIITIPQPVQTLRKTKLKALLLEDKVYAPIASNPHLINQVDFKSLHIKPQIHGNIVLANKTNLIKRDLELSAMFTPLQKELFSIINNYQDLYFPERTFTNADEIRYTYCLHVVNHMLKTRTKIIHHNAKLAKKSQSKENYSEEFRDQGLVRPKVLIIVPFRDAAYRIVKTLIDLVVPKEAGQVINKNRFECDFTGNEILMPTKNPKPEDYELLFSGNTDDTFRIGMTLTKKTLKLYTDFYSSDIIIASPLGLRMIVGAEGEEERDYDFLASIEVLIMDQTDVFLMQNWEHLLHVLDHLHLQPKKTHGADFSRVRLWAVNGWSKYYRQTLVFSSVTLPEIKSILNRHCKNYAGRAVVFNYPVVSSIQEIVVQVPHLFHRFSAADPPSSVEARFQYFVKEVLPKQLDALMSHTLIYVPSYFDYVQIRNHLKKENINFVQICEYTKDAKIARARDMFFHTEAHFLLYTERAHFFRRLRVKGVRHIIFYQPPAYPHFYSELCNLMLEGYQNKYGGSKCNMTVTILYSKYDMHRLAAILGESRLASIATSDKSVHMYITGAK